MECIDFQDEELVVTKAVGLAFHGLDLVVGAFQRYPLGAGLADPRDFVAGQRAADEFATGLSTSNCLVFGSTAISMPTPANCRSIVSWNAAKLSGERYVE